MTCKNWIEIKDGQVTQAHGLFQKGKYVICLDCRFIWKLLKRVSRELYKLKKVKRLQKRK